ncbi:ABATE domain-containing protein [Amycolatopsis sp. NPDC058278]|uniref:ABATE domain-containing protein n=1 Tax=Amycolatopsis sp. NPDC058278 TaxID=3346417 RepID=UPI0036DC234A
MTHETLLLDLLHTTPVRDGRPEDDLAAPRAAREWLATHGQPATDDEHRALLEARSVLQGVVRGEHSPGRSAAARAVPAWDALAESSPGRLRP